jgi:hypothetical protein
VHTEEDRQALKSESANDLKDESPDGVVFRLGKLMKEREDQEREIPILNDELMYRLDGAMAHGWIQKCFGD